MFIYSVPYKFHHRPKDNVDVLRGWEENTGTAGLIQFIFINQSNIGHINTEPCNTVIHIFDIFFAAQSVYYDFSNFIILFFTHQCIVKGRSIFSSWRLDVEVQDKPFKDKIGNHAQD